MLQRAVIAERVGLFVKREIEPYFRKRVAEADELARRASYPGPSEKDWQAYYQRMLDDVMFTLAIILHNCGMVKFRGGELVWNGLEPPDPLLLCVLGFVPEDGLSLAERTWRFAVCAARDMTVELAIPMAEAAISYFRDHVDWEADDDR